MTKPSISFRDSIGAVTITGVPYGFSGWTPDVIEISDREVPQGTGIEEFWRYRRDFVARFELGAIPAADLAQLHRLKSHLLTGGFITVSTNDAASRVYTCSIWPGETPAWSLTDRARVRYTLSLAVRNVMPYPLICDYSSFGGANGNLLVNGGGESGTIGAQAPNWTLEVSPIRSTDLLTPTADASFAGSRSLTRLIADTNVSVATQAHTLTVGTRYALSAWVKMTAIAAGTKDSTWPHGAGIAVGAGGIGYSRVFRYGGSIRADSLTGYPGVELVADGAAHDWTFIAALVDVVSSPSSFNLFLMSAGDAGQVWFDEVRLEPVPAV